MAAKMLSSADDDDAAFAREHSGALRFLKSQLPLEPNIEREVTWTTKIPLGTIL